MTKGADNIVSIMVMDRSYPVKCPPTQAAQLRESAKYLDEQIRKLEQPGVSANTERLTVIAALNITHELMMYKNQHNAQVDGLHEHAKSLQHRIQQFLMQQDAVPEPRALARDALV